MAIRLAETDAEIAACFDVMAELRPHLDRDKFVERVRAQAGDGYRLVALSDGNTVISVAGYRIYQNLAWGQMLYVDDLVTASTRRSEGFGEQLLDWLVEQARQAGCEELHLDSGVQRHGAHRFYLRLGMDISAHHFALKLRP